MSSDGTGPRLPPESSSELSPGRRWAGHCESEKTRQVAKMSLGRIVPDVVKSL